MSRALEGFGADRLMLTGATPKEAVEILVCAVADIERHLLAHYTATPEHVVLPVELVRTMRRAFRLYNASVPARGQSASRQPPGGFASYPASPDSSNPVGGSGLSMRAGEETPIGASPSPTDSEAASLTGITGAEIHGSPPHSVASAEGAARRDAPKVDATA